jgi:hypothetical protein
MAVLMPIRLPCAVHQRAPRIAGVDRRVGLDEVLEGVDPEVRATQRRDDTHGHRLTDAERVADGQHDVADANVVHLPEGDRRQGVALSLPLCRMICRPQGRTRVAAHQRAFRLRPSLSAISIWSAASTT